ncbi:excalibur calcium-binding domain-containing protein [Psychrobacillus sp. FSL K6-2684]|uniref:excalibur calcium-binding domain-containing protein n=1 Tax=Psychrobacillus sp. FSL K6-2684 TaxID=2921547 RepID=UPI0030F8A801
MQKLLKLVLVTVFTLGLISFNTVDAEASIKVMWGKTELKEGQIGKITIINSTELVKLESNASLSTVRMLKSGEEFRVYSYKSQHGGLYGVGGGSFVKKDNKAKYETPSKAKLGQLEEAIKNLAPVVTAPTTPKVEAGLEVVKGAPSSFKNCTALKQYYPNGVMKGHPAYASKHDRDKDGWACEPY